MYPHELILGDEGQKVVQDALKVKKKITKKIVFPFDPAHAFFSKYTPVLAQVGPEKTSTVLLQKHTASLVKI